MFLFCCLNGIMNLSKNTLFNKSGDTDNSNLFKSLACTHYKLIRCAQLVHNRFIKYSLLIVICYVYQVLKTYILWSPVRAITGGSPGAGCIKHCIKDALTPSSQVRLWPYVWCWEVPSSPDVP